jgi:hypothetical protein
VTLFTRSIGTAALAASIFASASAMAITDPAAPPETEQQSRAEAQAQHIAEVCAKTTCRTETHEVRLKTADGAGYALKTQLFPYEDDGTVILFPGEAVEFDLAADGMPMDVPHFVKVIDHVDTANVTGAPPSEAEAKKPGARAKLSVEFRQEADKPDMMLVFRSDLHVALKYNAIILAPTKDGLKSGRTSSCPVKAGLLSFEHWPFPIAMVVLSDFHVALGDDLACK